MRCERGYTRQLPDLAVWLKRSGPPLALITENGGRREDRQKWILRGWDEAIYAGQYSDVLYDCASPSVAQWIKRLAREVGLTSPKFTACVQPGAAQIAALSPAAPEDDPPVDEREPARPPSADQRMPFTPVPAAPTPQPVMDAEPAPRAEPESADAEAERMRRYREIFGIEEPKRRRWRR
jgi:hypothetical protein